MIWDVDTSVIFISSRLNPHILTLSGKGEGHGSEEDTHTTSLSEILVVVISESSFSFWNIYILRIPLGFHSLLILSIDVT